MRVSKPLCFVLFSPSEPRTLRPAKEAACLAEQTQMAAPASQQHAVRDDEAGSQQSVDPIDELLANYNFICHPELRLKFKQE